MIKKNKCPICHAKHNNLSLDKLCLECSEKIGKDVAFVEKKVFSLAEICWLLIMMKLL
jgi:hypothetical protein